MIRLWFHPPNLYHRTNDVTSNTWHTNFFHITKTIWNEVLKHFPKLKKVLYSFFWNMYRIPTLFTIYLVELTSTWRLVSLIVNFKHWILLFKVFQFLQLGITYWEEVFIVIEGTQCFLVNHNHFVFFSTTLIHERKIKRWKIISLLQDCLSSWFFSNFQISLERYTL